MTSRRGPRALGHTAVMAQRAPAIVEADSAQVALWRKLEFFPTPPWGARAGAEQLLAVDPGAWSFWDPCAGQHHMAAPLAEYSPLVHRSDIHDYGMGDLVEDFTDDRQAGPEADWIVANPPFGRAADFVRLGLQRARRGVAILQRLAFTETGDRYALFDGGEYPLTRLAIFSERLPMTLGAWRPKGDTATAYAWFIWRKGAAPLPPAWIPPGTRDRLWARDDVQRFAWRAPTPLLDEIAT